MKENCGGTTPFRRYPMYQTIFLGSCYSCNKFGYKAINCKDYAKNKDNNEGHFRINHLIKPHQAYNRNHNSFGSLRNEVECYKCNNFGHMDKDCRLPAPPKKPKQDFNNHQKRIWIKKQDKLNVEERSLALQTQSRRSDQYVDSGCLKYMTGDKNRFITL
jgi:hypothetical protein